MKIKYFAMVIASLGITSTTFGLEQEFNLPLSNNPPKTDKPTKQVIADNQASNNPAMQGANASGINQTTVVDENGNLKVVNTAKPNSSLPINTNPMHPGMSWTKPGMSQQNAATGATTPSQSLVPPPGKMPPQPALGNQPPPPAQPNVLVPQQPVNGSAATATQNATTDVQAPAAAPNQTPSSATTLNPTPPARVNTSSMGVSTH